MNTIRSTWYGWATLCVAGGGAYYFAKKQINADRADRYNKERLKQERLHRLESSSVLHGDNQPLRSKKTSRTSEAKIEPSHEASQDPAAVAHEVETDGQKGREKSKYEAAEPFKSRKGDRFS